MINAIADRLILVLLALVILTGNGLIAGTHGTDMSLFLSGLLQDLLVVMVIGYYIHRFVRRSANDLVTTLRPRSETNRIDLTARLDERTPGP